MGCLCPAHSHASSGKALNTGGGGQLGFVTVEESTRISSSCQSTATTVALRLSICSAQQNITLEER